MTKHFREHEFIRSEPTGPVALRDLSGSDEVLPLHENFDTIILPLAPVFVSGLPAMGAIEAAPGSVIFVPASKSDTIGFIGSFDVIALFVFSGTHDPQGASDWSFHPQLPDDVHVVTSPRQIAAIAQIAKRICTSGRAHERDLSHAITHLILAEIASQIGHRQQVASLRRSALDNRRIRAIDSYVDDHLEEPLCLKQLAQQADMTSYQFSRRFKDTTGISPFQYVIAKRVRRARDLLQQGKDSIAEVAYATGFSSQSHLTETFKRHFGVTPGAYKRAQNQVA